MNPVARPDDRRETMEPIHPAFSETMTEAGAAHPSDPGRFEKVGFRRRAMAYLLDLLAVESIYGFFMIIGVLAVALSSDEDLGLSLVEDSAFGLSGFFVFLWSALFLTYFSFFTFWGGQTPGKMLLGLRVVTNDYREPTLQRALARSLCYFLSSAFLGLGFLMAAVDREKRTLHDFIAGTYVVKQTSPS
jgi:uncharacterized RDD family membrane protein YckC